MPWSSGNYTKGNNSTGGWTGDASAGIGIEAGRHDTQDNDFATGINQCLNKDGSNAATGNLNIGAFRVTNVGAATARSDAAQVGQVQDGDYIWLGTTAGTATAQTASATPAITAYKTGQKFRAIIGAGLSSTGQIQTNHTININSLGAKTIANGDEVTSVTNGTWVAGNIIELVYDGTYMRITNDPGGWKDWTPTLYAPIGTVSGVSVSYARFRKMGHQVTIQGYVTFTHTGVGPQIEITNPPVALAITGGAFVIQPLFVSTAGANNVGYMYNNSGTNIAFTKDMAATSFGTSTGNTRFHYIYQGV